MRVRNNYNECLTNLACSVRKYFGLEYRHNSLDYIDKILDDRKPDNVIVILFDGMGSRILDRILDSNDFFIRNRLKEITTVFPATTTAATTSIITGLNPIEHGYLGWDMYINSIDKTISLFKVSEKGKQDICLDFNTIKDKLDNDSIVEDINKKGVDRAFELFPFGEDKYDNLDDMLNKIIIETKKDGKKYIYAYDDEPDYTMHVSGTYSKEVVDLIKIRNKKVEDFCNKIKNSIVIVVADHGHIPVENIFLSDYPVLYDMLERTTSIEPRACSFKVKKGLDNEFRELFINNFGKDFRLYDKEDIINSRLFGDGKEHEFFRDAIGDFIAIAYSNKCLIDNNNTFLSHHAGYTDDEIYVPLIVIER